MRVIDEAGLLELPAADRVVCETLMRHREINKVVIGQAVIRQLIARHRARRKAACAEAVVHDIGVIDGACRQFLTGDRVVGDGVAVQAVVADELHGPDRPLDLELRGAWRRLGRSHPGEPPDPQRPIGAIGAGNLQPAHLAGARRPHRKGARRIVEVRQHPCPDLVIDAARGWMVGADGDVLLGPSRKRKERQHPSDDGPGQARPGRRLSLSREVFEMSWHFTHHSSLITHHSSLIAGVAGCRP